jgi:uncharacterized protein YwgA
MKRYDLSSSPLVQVIHTAGVIKDRSKLQKIVYLLMKKFPNLFSEQDYSFRLTYWGPFSNELAEDISNLTAFGVVSECHCHKCNGLEMEQPIKLKVEPLPPEIINYVHRLNKKGYEWLVESSYKKYTMDEK